ncbi:hypothetical protein GUITHDRAFT_111104 [Guillardia theta CCMP2712]|uniref:Uncharacterized protein n=1 Tax=Guillardia theta (strain CCMP2712) TaxID=905079 RepID=L1J3F1_GUITC|nr:hypothetical protein GUITHDRAFT_111104 [Guillardia theta CCMP2712]EKX43058.1 hypothetical protein GUITHDRAFT_111104 [Guillardia theta CCMP2712]|eukprot:XP_005830038.1 hypothetical protein GUITHDRAFT_111104 [Guillardia theta CCMP2712]
MFGAGAAFLLMRERLRLQALQEARKEAACGLEERWEEMRTSSAIETLSRVVKRATAYAELDGRCRGPIVVVSTEDSSQSPEEIEPEEPRSATGRQTHQACAASLDQLYAQAVLLDPIFLLKVQSLAETVDGYLPAWEGREGPSYVRWREAVADRSMERRVRWASIKSASRAIEKVQLLCHGRLSDLTDVVRQSLVFTGVEELTESGRGDQRAGGERGDEEEGGRGARVRAQADPEPRATADRDGCWDGATSDL